MKQFIDKLIERLEEKFKYNSEQAEIWRNCSEQNAYFRGQKDLYMDRANIYGEVMRIVNQLAEEYNNESVNGDLISRSATIKELNGIYLDNPWDDKEDILEKAIGIVDHQPTACNDGWIPCSERLPRIGEQVMVCNIYGSVFVSHITYLNPKITTNGECNDFGSHNDVIAWQPLPPAPYQPKGETKLYERKSNAGEYTDYTGEWV